MDYHQQLRDSKCFGNVKPTEKKIKPIAKMSAKRKVDDKEYKKVRKEYLKNHIRCEVKSCNKVSEEIHHKRGRVGKLLFDSKYFLAVCREHHSDIEINPLWAKENGYSINRLKKDI